MALRKLNELIDKTDAYMKEMMKTGSDIDILNAWKAYAKLRTELKKAMSFVEHDWSVKLYTPTSSATIKIKADHIEEARATATDLIDTFSEVVRYELYCDGILLAEHE